MMSDFVYIKLTFNMYVVIDKGIKQTYVSSSCNVSFYIFIYTG